jgi:phosphate transport system substrate-binding protein
MKSRFPGFRRVIAPAVLAPAVFLFVFAGATSCSRLEERETATKGSLSVCASESHLELIQTEADEFTSQYQQADVTVFGATTRDAIVYLLNDSVSVIVVDRLLNPEEEQVVKKSKIKLERVEVALDAVAIVVNHLNDAKGISKEVLRDILVKKVTDWNQVSGAGLSGPVALVMTGKNSGTYELVKDHFFGLPADVLPSVVLATQQEVLEYVARHPQAIGVVSLASFMNPSVQALSVDSTSALIRALSFAGQDSTGNSALFKLHQAHIYLGKYPLSYPVYAYFRKESNLAAGFVGFIAGPAGQKIILNWGLVPVTMPVRIVTLT